MHYCTVSPQLFVCEHHHLAASATLAFSFFMLLVPADHQSYIFMPGWWLTLQCVLRSYARTSRLLLSLYFILVLQGRMIKHYDTTLCTNCLQKCLADYFKEYNTVSTFSLNSKLYSVFAQSIRTLPSE